MGLDQSIEPGVVGRVESMADGVDDMLLLALGDAAPVEWHLGPRLASPVRQDPVDVVVMTSRDRHGAIGKIRPLVYRWERIGDVVEAHSNDWALRAHPGGSDDLHPLN